MSGHLKAVRVCWKGPDPKPGQWIVSKGGRYLYLVRVVQVLHRAKLSTAPRLRLLVEPKRVIDMPPEDIPTSTLPWSLTDPPGEDAVRAERIRIRSVNAVEQTARRARVLAAPKSTIEPVRKTRGDIDVADWVDRTKATVRGFRRACPLRRAYRMGNSEIGIDHIRAADLVRAAYDKATIGLSPGGIGLKPGHVHTQHAPSFGPGAGAIAQVQAGREYRRTLACVGAARTPLFLWVVINNNDVASWVVLQSQLQGRTVDRHRETGKLIAILDDLVEHYGAELRDAAAKGEDAA